MSTPLKRPLHVLFTILGYAWRSGSETHVRDLALGLTRRGHFVTIFAPTLGDMAYETRRQGVTITDSVSHLKEAPDLIHGNHVLPIAEALIAFPKTPAFWTCHDWLSWHDEPPLFPQILRYAGVDELCLERVIKAGVERQRTTILPNGVDFSRVPERPMPLNQRPASAVVFGKANGARSVIEQACRELDLPLAPVGGGDAPIVSAPERELVRHDIVFATARSASEALASGCAVVLVDARGVGGLVTSASYERMQAFNFGRRCLTDPLSAEAIVSALKGYDSSDALAVAMRHRKERDVEHVLDDLEQTYADILAEASGVVFESADLLRALAPYVRQFTPHASPEANWPWHCERTALLARIAELERALEKKREEERPVEWPAPTL